MTDKKDIYEDLLKQAEAVLEGESYLWTNMSTLTGLLKNTFKEVYWVGFYVEHEGLLKVGPYQGTLGCIHISFDRGVCGRAFRTREVQIVDDVHADPEHIACDPKSCSEIVIPVLDSKGVCRAVLDVDSDKLAAFDEIDRKYLGLLVARHISPNF